MCTRWRQLTSVPQWNCGYARLNNQQHACLHSAERLLVLSHMPTSTCVRAGQRQRVAIARALVKEPRILLMDEATSALDSESESAIMAALDNVSKGRTVITIAHRLSTMQHSDLVAVLSEGRIAECGPFAELFNNPDSTFRQLIDKQLLGVKLK